MRDKPFRNQTPFAAYIDIDKPIRGCNLTVFAIIPRWNREFAMGGDWQTVVIGQGIQKMGTLVLLMLP